jgi:hypothetical protein
LPLSYNCCWWSYKQKIFFIVFYGASYIVVDGIVNNGIFLMSSTKQATIATIKDIINRFSLASSKMHKRQVEKVAKRLLRKKAIHKRKRVVV